MRPGRQPRRRNSTPPEEERRRDAARGGAGGADEAGDLDGRDIQRLHDLGITQRSRLARWT
jgi:hypothetical protein